MVLNHSENMALLTRQPSTTNYSFNPCAAYNGQTMNYNQDYGQYCQMQDAGNNYQQTQWNHPSYGFQEWGNCFNPASPAYPSYPGTTVNTNTHGHTGIDYNVHENSHPSLTVLGTPQPQPSVSPAVSSGGSSSDALSPGSKQRQPYDWMKRTTYQCTPTAGKTRTKDKYRVVYSDHQRLELEKEFHYSRYITIRRKAELAHNLSLSERQVKIWFQNRRAKERKQNKKREDTVTSVSACKVEQQMSPHAHMHTPDEMSTQIPQMHTQVNLQSDMNVPQSILLPVKSENSIDNFHTSPSCTPVTSLPQPNPCAVNH